MKKISLIIICIMLCALAFTACGDKEQPNVTTADSSDISTTDITTDETNVTTAAEPVETAETTEKTDTVPETGKIDATTDASAPDITPPASEIKTAEIQIALEKELSALKTGTIKEGTYMAESPFANEDEATYKALYAKFEYVIGDVTVVNATTATVDATIKMTDTAAAFTTYMSEIFAHSEDENWDSDFKVFYDLLSGENAKINTYDIKVNMKLTDNGWAIDDENNAELANAICGGLASIVDENN